MNPSPAFWQNKCVLVTGHSGFKGAWLTLWLHKMGAKIYGISLEPETSPNLFELAGIRQLCQASHLLDIRKAADLAAVVQQIQPDIVFHLAAQALVRPGYRDPLQTFSTNLMGTANVLDALRNSPATKVAVMVTTDKVYKNKEWVWPYREADELGGHDPYSASKAASELIIDSYRKSFLEKQGLAVASARAGNVIGGGDWSEDRLLPDAIRAWEARQVLSIRHPQATRPWQHVLEPLSGYLLLAEKLWAAPELTGAYNFGPHTQEAATVQQVIELATTDYPNARVHLAQNTDSQLHEAGYLALEIASAKALLGFQPRWDLPRAVRQTMSWYRQLQAGSLASSLCLEDINAYTS